MLRRITPHSARTTTRLQLPATAELFAEGGDLAAFLLGQFAGQANSRLRIYCPDINQRLFKNGALKGVPSHVVTTLPAVLAVAEAIERWSKLGSSPTFANLGIVFSYRGLWIGGWRTLRYR